MATMHVLPGRIRFRQLTELSNPALRSKAEKALGAIEGVSATINPTTNSVLVLFDPHLPDQEGMRRRLIGALNSARVASAREDLPLVNAPPTAFEAAAGRVVQAGLQVGITLALGEFALLVPAVQLLHTLAKSPRVQIETHGAVIDDPRLAKDSARVKVLRSAFEGVASVSVKGGRLRVRFFEREVGRDQIEQVVARLSSLSKEADVVDAGRRALEHGVSSAAKKGLAIAGTAALKELGHKELIRSLDVLLDLVFAL